MSNTTKSDPEKFLTQRKLAERWRCSERTLQRWRSTNSGPTFLRLGGCVRYRIADVLEFEDRNRMCEAEL